MPSTTEPKHIITIDSNITHNVINHLPEQSDELSDPSSYHKLDRKSTNQKLHNQSPSTGEGETTNAVILHQ